MQRHEQRDPEPRKPPQGETATKWLLFVIAVLLGLVASEIAKRFM